MEMSIHFFFDIFDILHFLHWWTSQGQNIEQMASKMRSVTINKIAKLEWMMVYNFQLKFEISFYCINLRLSKLFWYIRKPIVSPIFSHGCPDFMSHPSMQFRIIKNSAVACPNPILTWCKISTRCCFLNAILQLSKHFQCIQQKFTTFSLSLCLSSRCSCCNSGCCCCETHSDTHVARAAVADVCVRMVWLLGVFWREL